MNYYSYLDNLNLTLEELIELSPYKLKEIVDELSLLNIDNQSTIISGIQDSVSRSYHITIEQNTWLKDLFYSRFDCLKKTKIELSFEYTNYIGGLKLFIELYIRPILPDLVNQLIAENELKLLFQILSQSDLFSKACKNDIILLLKNKVTYAINYTGKSQIDNPDLTIKYIKNYHFYEILNLYESYFKEDLIKLYDNISDIVEQFDSDSKDPIFRFFSQAQVAFQKSEIDDVATKLFIDNNAENAKDYAYNYDTEVEITDRKIPFLKNNLTLIFGLSAFIIIMFAIIFNKTHQGNEELEVSQTENYSDKKKRTTYDNRIRFYYSLKRITAKAKTDSIILNKTKITSYANPYPKTFNQITNSKIVSKKVNVQIVNGTGNDLIVFKMIKGKDESIYIPQDKTIFISLNRLDSILFYSGKSFSTSKFSHFNEPMGISDIYKVRKIDSAAFSSITITPIDSTTNSNNKIISKQNIETTANVKLNRLGIEHLYRDYYSKYNN